MTVGAQTRILVSPPSLAESTTAHHGPTEVIPVGLCIVSLTSSVVVRLLNNNCWSCAVIWCAEGGLAVAAPIQVEKSEAHCGREMV